MKEQPSAALGERVILGPGRLALLPALALPERRYVGHVVRSMPGV